MILRILIDVIKTSLITDTSSLLHNRNRLFLCLKLSRNVSKTNVLLILILYEPQKRSSTNEPFSTIQSFDLLFFIYICSKLKSGNSDHTLNFYSMIRISLFLLVLCLGFACSKSEEVVNVYSHRHYDVDKILYKQFTEETGIKVNVVSAGADELIQRISSEGERTQADLLINLVAGLLNRANQADILTTQPDTSVTSLVPDYLHDKDFQWMPLTKRARVFVYHKDRVSEDDLSSYEDLMNEKWQNRLLIRSSQNVYNQSLLASFIALEDSAYAANWTNAVVKNLAREPKGGDRDQIKAVAAGMGDLAISNTYYLGLMLNSTNEEEQKVAEQMGIFFPSQNGSGTHVNVSGIGLVKYAKNIENAEKLINFLLRKDTQQQFALGNYEYPVRSDVEWSPLLKEWGTFKEQEVSMNKLGEYNRTAVTIFDQAGWR